ncbi:LCP family protein [Mariniluteicoccus flavus]
MTVDPVDQPAPPAPRRAGSSRSPVPDAQRRADALRLRRAVGNLGLTLVVPGSAQLLHGDRRVGRVAMRVWAGLWTVLLALLVVFAVSRGSAIAILTFTPITWLMALVIGAAGLGWAYLMVDAWRLSRPPELAQHHRLGYGLVAGTLALALGVGGIASANVVQAQGDFLGTVFSGGGDTRTKGGRYNVLLLGGDAGTGREGLRPDSMTVASIDAKTGKTVLFSLPRNLEDVEFPDSSPMKKIYPGRFSCPNHECLLNAVYTKAMEHKELYPGVKDPGAVATKEAISWVTGLEINYYALIDLNGFKSLIDAVGGVKVDVMKRVPVGGGSTEVKRYIEPGRAVHMNGQNALWYARSRHESTDYERMARQKCVMNAMLNQLDPVTVITRFQSIAGAGKQIVETDVPTSEMERLGTLAMKARQTKIASVSFVPPLVQPGRPDFGVIRETVRTRIAAQTPRPKGQEVPATSAPPAPAPAPGPAVTEAPSATPTKKAKATPTRSSRKATPTPTLTPTPTPVSEPGTDDLGLVCQAA